MRICYLVSVLNIFKSRKLLYAAGLFLLLTNTFAKSLAFVQVHHQSLFVLVQFAFLRLQFAEQFFLVRQKKFLEFLIDKYLNRTRFVGDFFI